MYIICYTYKYSKIIKKVKWLQTHVIIHKDGGSQHINFIKDKNGVAHYTTFK
jgi:hypothetical protein